MINDPPINFQELAQSGGNPSAGGYPYQLRALDLDKNFVYATCDFPEPFIVTEKTGAFGLPTREISLLPTLPTSGKYVLGCIDGGLTWIETESC